MTISRQRAIMPHLKLRAKVLAAIRRFFSNHGFVEVDTPIRIPAPAPEAHILAEPSGNAYLHTSPELYMKRLVAAGYKRIFQICHCFRRKERGRRHLPEFSLLEWYFTPGDYLEMMDQTSALVQSIAEALGRGKTLSYRGNCIDLTPPWERMSVSEAFDRFSPISMQTALNTQRFDEIMGLMIEPKLGQTTPLFLYDYPAEAGALARLKTNTPGIAERFELYIAGVELCNAFSELTDATEQRRRFELELKQRKAAGHKVYPMPEKFLQSLAEMPPTCGNALGLDRLVMLFADTEEIDDVVPFTPEEL